MNKKLNTKVSLTDIMEHRSIKSPRFKFSFGCPLFKEKGIYILSDFCPHETAASIFLVEPIRIITPSRVEAELLRVVSRTQFGGFKITTPRFSCDIASFHSSVLWLLFKWCLDTEITNYSWLEPLQALIMQLTERNKKKVNKSPTWYNQGADGPTFMVGGATMSPESVYAGIVNDLLSANVPAAPEMTEEEAEVFLDENEPL